MEFSIPANPFRTPGGVHAPHRKHTANSQSVEMPAPGMVVIPMSMHIGAHCTPTVKVGEEVLVDDTYTSSFSFITNKIATVRGADEATEATVFIVVSLFSSLFFLGFHDFVGFGRSIGKRIMGLILVEKLTGARTTIKKRLLRNVLKSLFVIRFYAAGINAIDK